MPRRKFAPQKSRLSRQVRSVVKNELKRQHEKKRISITYNASAISTTGADNAFGNLITGGTGTTNRIGHKIKMTGLYGQFYMTAADTTNVMRVVIYRPRQVGTNLSTDGLAVRGNIDPDKYIIYFDKIYTMSTTGSTYVRAGKAKLRLNGTTQYDASTGNPLTNDLLIYTVSDSGVASHPTMDGTFHLYFTDM